MEQIKLDIPRVLIFTKVSSTRLNNTLHVQYHRKQYELVMAVDKTKLKLPLGLPEAWNKGIDYETMIDQEATISDDTALLKVKDAERDEQLMNIFGIIRAQRHSHKTNIREAAIRLSNTLSPYENIRSLAYEMESGRLEGMKKDLTKRTAEVATLGLNDEFDNLFKLNEEFEKLHVGRRVENTDTKLPLASVSRPGGRLPIHPGGLQQRHLGRRQGPPRAPGRPHERHLERLQNDAAQPRRATQKGHAQGAQNAEGAQAQKAG